MSDQSGFNALYEENSSLDVIDVTALHSKDREQWLGLWREYLQFYEIGLPQEVTDRTWLSILEAERVSGIGAWSRGALVGFAIAVVHERTWSIGMTAYLEDLFVAPSARRIGVGRALIDRVIADARERACESVYWHTGANNAAARRLYDRYCGADDFIRYRLSLS